MEPLLETWRINCRINDYLLEALSEEQLGTPLSKGKVVCDQFAHIHTVRLMWLKASAPDLMEGLEKPEKGAPKTQLAEALVGSGLAIEELLKRAGEPDGKVKGFKPHVSAFVGYLIAHESFHRAQAELALRQAGIPLPDKVAYGLWEWGTR